MAELTTTQANHALVDANGDFDAAAATLGVTKEWLREVCKRDPALKKRWLDKPEAPPPTSIIHRPEDVALVEALQREEAELSAGVARLTKSDRARQLAVTCQQFQRQNMTKVMQITGGGITKLFLETLEEIEKITHRLEYLDVPPEQTLAWETILREDRARLIEACQKMATKVDNGAMIMAKLHKLAEGSSSTGRGTSKPGFTPLKRVVELPSDPPPAQ